MSPECKPSVFCQGRRVVVVWSGEGDQGHQNDKNHHQPFYFRSTMCCCHEKYFVHPNPEPFPDSVVGNSLYLVGFSLFSLLQSTKSFTMSHLLSRFPNIDFTYLFLSHSPHFSGFVSLFFYYNLSGCSN